MFQQNRLNVNHNSNASNHHISDLKSDIVRIVGSTTASSNVVGVTNNNYNTDERITSAATTKAAASSTTTTTTRLQRHGNNYLINSSNNNLPKQEEPKSHFKLRASNFHSLSQHSQQQQQVQNNSNNNNSQDMQHSSNNQRNGHLLANSATINQTFPNPPPLVQGNQTTTTSSRSSSTSQQITPSKPQSELGQAFNLSQQRQRQQQPPLVSTNITSSSSSASNFLGLTSQLRDDFRAGRQSTLMTSANDHQQERETNEVVTTMIKEELENDINSLKESELETLGSLERALPIEVSFLLRQQAYCMAKLNYLDRQLRELKEAQHQAHLSPRATSSTNNNNNIINPNNVNLTTTSAATAVHSKNGNFIASDDSGGEYSRATISDDDELSSLLDQIAKSVRPDQSRQPAMQLNQRQPSLNSRASLFNHQMQLQQQQHQQQQILSHQHQQRFNYNVIGNPPPQQYTIINPNQLHHHQAVPVFVMSSPITVAHPSSISSNVLPGVHFQPEPRYNQYYEDFFVHNNSNSTPSTIHGHSNSNSNGIRSHQFDSSMTAIEQLVSQKEKRQIKSQLKSADNWLKMHSSGLSTLIGQNFSNTNNNANFNNSNGPPGDDLGGLEIGGNPNDRNIPSSTSTLANGSATNAATMATENSKSVIEETRNSR